MAGQVSGTPKADIIWEVPDLFLEGAGGDAPSR